MINISYLYYNQLNFYIVPKERNILFMLKDATINKTTKLYIYKNFIEVGQQELFFLIRNCKRPWTKIQVNVSVLVLLPFKINIFKEFFQLMIQMQTWCISINDTSRLRYKLHKLKVFLRLLRI